MGNEFCRERPACRSPVGRGNHGNGTQAVPYIFSIGGTSFNVKNQHVIARRAKPDVAISWYKVRSCRKYQEIATPSARNDVVTLGWSFYWPCGS